MRLWNDGTDENRNCTRSCNGLSFLPLEYDRLGWFHNEQPCFSFKKRKETCFAFCNTQFLQQKQESRAPNEINYFSKLSKKKRGICFFLSDRISKKRKKQYSFFTSDTILFLFAVPTTESNPEQTRFFPFAGTAFGKMLPSGGKGFWKRYANVYEEEQRLHNSFSDEEN